MLSTTISLLYAPVGSVNPLLFIRILQRSNVAVVVSHTTIVFTRYTILEWTHLKENDEKTYGELFFMFCDDIQDMDLANALQSLMALFVEQFSAFAADITACIKSKVTE